MSDPGADNLRWPVAALFSLFAVQVIIVALWWFGAFELSTAARASSVIAIACFAAIGVLRLLGRSFRNSRHYQFSLRGFIVGITVVCVLLSCFVLLTSAGRQRTAVATMGCAAEWRPGPRWLTQVFGKDYFGTVTMVYTDQQGFADADLAHAKHLVDIKQIYLPGTSITDKGLESLAGLGQLEELGLDHTGVTDAGIRQLQKLKKLKRLVLIGTRVSDAGVEDLTRELPELRVER